MTKRIIEFIGYIPFKLDDISIGLQLYYARLITGKTQQELAEHLCCDESNLRRIELGERNPNNKIRTKILEYFESAISIANSY